METSSWNGDGLWIFALLLLFGMGGFGGFGNATSRTATVEDLNSQTNASRIESMIQNNGNLTETKFDNLTKGLCDGFYNNAMQINGLEKTITTQIQALSSKIDADKIATLQAQVNDLKTQNYFNNVPRINPYAYGVYPYVNGCGCNCNNI